MVFSSLLLSMPRGDRAPPCRIILSDHPSATFYPRTPVTFHKRLKKFRPFPKSTGFFLDLQITASFRKSKSLYRPHSQIFLKER